MKEAEIKLSVIRWLLAQLEPDEIIASELQFADATSRADLVVSSLRRLTAFEIKSSYDDFRRFERQQEAYRNAFLDSYLVVPVTLLKQAREYLAQSTGIVTISGEGTVRLQRKAKSRQQLSRDEALRWLRAADRKKYENESIQDRAMTHVALATIYQRLSPRFNAFRAELSVNLNSDDLSMLSLPTRIR